MSAATTTQLTCPRCGADGQGAAWCPDCGLNLRIQPPEAPPVTDEQPAVPPLPPVPETPLRTPQRRPDEREGRRPSVVALVAVLAVLAVGGTVFGVLALTGGDDGPQIPPTTPAGTSATSIATPPEPEPELPPVSPPPAPTVDEAAMTRVLMSYQIAYSAEDLDALASLFAMNLERRSADEPPQDIGQALVAYGEQFASLSNPTYRLSNVVFTEGEGEGFATGTYEILHGDGFASGRIGFRFVGTDDGPLIVEIAIDPTE